MAMQSSGEISIQDLKIVFGAGATRGMSDFYRGGTFVPDIAANSGQTLPEFSLYPLKQKLSLHTLLINFCLVCQ